jgi:hypothetical protein
MRKRCVISLRSAIDRSTNEKSAAKKAGQIYKAASSLLRAKALAGVKCAGLQTSAFYKNIDYN